MATNTEYGVGMSSSITIDQDLKVNPKVRCIQCGAEKNLWTTASSCECGGLLEIVWPLGEYEPSWLKDTWASRMGSLLPIDRSGVWRFRELVSPVDGEAIITRGEGNTGLYNVPKLADWVGVDTLYLKHEGENPTGSFKDRGMTVGVSVARHCGATIVACASTGNTSASLASYAAIADMRCVVLLPAGKVSAAKLSQSIAYGAKTIAIRGDFDKALSLLQSTAPQLGLYILNSVNPWRLEGQKTVMYELLESLRWEVPDWIFLPGGNLGNTSAFGKALLEMRSLGLIDRLPRIGVVQAEGAAPFAHAYKSGWQSYSPVKAETVATAIRIGDPVNYQKARRVVQELDGLVTSVSDREILDAKAMVDGAGVGCEPASAASVAGIRKLMSERIISPDSKVVAVLTGHILKDPDATFMYHTSDNRFSNKIIEVDADPKSIISVVESL